MDRHAVLDQMARIQADLEIKAALQWPRFTEVRAEVARLMRTHDGLSLRDAYELAVAYQHGVN